MLYLISSACSSCTFVCLNYIFESWVCPTKWLIHYFIDAIDFYFSETDSLANTNADVLSMPVTCTTIECFIYIATQCRHAHSIIPATLVISMTLRHTVDLYHLEHTNGSFDVASLNYSHRLKPCLPKALCSCWVWASR